MSYKEELGKYKTAMLLAKASFFELCIAGVQDVQKKTFNVLKELSHLSNTSPPILATQADCTALNELFLKKSLKLKGKLNRGVW